MATFLKQSTTVTIRLGPFLDKADGVTEKTAITPVVEVSKNHAAFGARNSATAITHDSNGWFAVELNATDTGTLGPMVAKSDDSATFLPVWREFVVVPANVHDSLVAGSATLAVDATKWAGAATAASNTALAAAPTNFSALSITAGGLVDMTQAAADKVWASATRTLTAFSTALAVSVWDVLESAIATASSIGLKVKTNLDATVSSRLASASYSAPPSAAANAAAVWDEARTGHVAAGTFGEGVASVQGNVTGSVGSVVGDTPQTGDCFARLGAPAGVSIAADIAAVPTAAANADALLDRTNGVETGLTLRQCLRLVSAALFGKLSGAATTTVAIRDFGDTKNRISATVDADGNRAAVVTDAS